MRQKTDLLLMQWVCDKFATRFMNMIYDKDWEKFMIISGCLKLSQSWVTAIRLQSPQSWFVMKKIEFLKENIWDR